MLQIPVFPHEIEYELPRLLIQQPGQLGVRAPRHLLDDRIEDDLPLLDAPPGEPLDLEEKLRAQAQKWLLGCLLVLAAHQHACHAVPPFDRVRIVATQLRLHTGDKYIAEAFPRPAQLRGVQRAPVMARQLGAGNPCPRRKE